MAFISNSPLIHISFPLSFIISPHILHIPVDSLLDSFPSLHYDGCITLTERICYLAHFPSIQLACPAGQRHSRLRPVQCACVFRRHGGRHPGSYAAAASLAGSLAVRIGLRAPSSIPSSRAAASRCSTPSLSGFRRCGRSWPACRCWRPSSARCLWAWAWA